MEGCWVIFGEECDVGLEQSVGVCPVAGEFRNEVSAGGVCDLDLCGLVRVNATVGVG